MERVPCVVVGAGAVGLAIGRAMSKAGVYTMVLESQSSFGSGNSSRNSEVLHAGLYYAPGSAKATLCNEGKYKMLSYLKERRIPYSQCGKLVIASSEDEIPTLHMIFKNGTLNGLDDLKMLNPKEVHELEPSVTCSAGMLSPFTSIFDSHNLMLSYIVEIEETGSDVVYNCAVESVQRTNSTSSSSSSACFEVVTSQGSILCDYLVNSAGLHAPHLAARMPFYPTSAIPPTYFAKGNYFKLQGVSSKEVPFRRLIYPIPQAGGLGVHATLDLEGNVKFGPNVEWMPFTKGHDLGGNGIGDGTGSVKGQEDRYLFPRGAPAPTDFTVSLNTVTSSTTSTATAEVFYREISRYWPGLQRHMLVPDYAGIRPKLCGPAGTPPSGQTSPDPAHGSNTSATTTTTTTTTATTTTSSKNSSNSSNCYEMPASADFAILGETVHGVPGLVALFGVESPGLTASLAIADHVRDTLLLRHK